jgi:anti-sigma regulatory factor (Ser/Thr protein kinase)
VHIRRSQLLFAARFDLETLTVVRRGVLRHLHLDGLSGTRADGFLIAVSEILANAIEHGGGSGTIEVRHVEDGPGARIECEIGDDGPGLPPGRHGTHLAGPADERGRGLRLAHMLSDRVLHHRVVAGTRITLTIAITPTAP